MPMSSRTLRMRGRKRVQMNKEPIQEQGLKERRWQEIKEGRR